MDGTVPVTASGRPIARPLRRLLWAFAGVGAGIIAALVVYQVSVQPGAAIVKAAFESGTEVKPPADFSTIAAAVTERPHVDIGDVGPMPATVDIYTPTIASATPRPMILWIHGGGFISSSADTVRDYSIMLANAGYTVASLNYSLAPGERHPTPVVQGNTALHFLQSNASQYGGDPTKIVLGGDSAGAQIAGEVAALQTNPALAASLSLTPALPAADLKAVVLFCGLYDMATVGDSGFPALRTYLWAYTGVREYTRYADIDQMSVTSQVTDRFPPTFITVGDADPFAGQAGELVAALTRKGVPTTPLFWTGSGANLGHEYQFNFNLPQAREAFQNTLSFLAAATKDAS